MAKNRKLAVHEILNESEHQKTFDNFVQMPSDVIDDDEKSNLKKIIKDEIRREINKLSVLTHIQNLKKSRLVGKISVEAYEDAEEVDEPNKKGEKVTVRGVNVSLNNTTNFSNVRYDLFESSGEEFSSMTYIYPGSENVEYINNSYDFINNIFKIAYDDVESSELSFEEYCNAYVFDDSFKKELELKQTKINESQDNKINEDEFYHYLMAIGGERNGFVYVADIGIFYQSNNCWRIIGGDLDIKNVDDGLKVIISMRKHKNPNFHNFMDIDEDAMRLKEGIQNNLNKAENRYYSYSDLMTKEGHNKDSDNVQVYYPYDNDDDIIENDFSENHLEMDMISIPQVNLNNEEKGLEPQSKEGLLLQLKQDVLVDNIDIDEGIKPINNNYTNEDSTLSSHDIMNMMIFNDYENGQNHDLSYEYEPYQFNDSNDMNQESINTNANLIEDNSINVYNNNSNEENNNEKKFMFEDLKEFSKEISIESFFEVALALNFNLKPTIEEFNSEKIHRIKIYKFVTKKDKDVSFKYAIKNNLWQSMNDNNKGEGLEELLIDLYDNLKIKLLDEKGKNSKIYVDFIHENEELLSQVNNKNKILNTYVENQLIDLSSFPIKLEEIVSNYSQKFKFLFNHADFENVERKGSLKPELKLDTLRYRFNNDSWYEFSTKETGNGYDSLIQHINFCYENKDKIVSVLNKQYEFLLKYISHDNFNKKYYALENDEEKLNLIESINLGETVYQEDVVESKIENKKIEDTNNISTINETVTEIENDYVEEKVEEAPTNPQIIAKQNEKDEINSLKEYILKIQKGEINKDKIESVLEELIKINKEILLNENNIFDIFTFKNVMDYCIKNNKPYKDFIFDEERNLYTNGKISFPSNINVNQLIDLIIAKYPKLKLEDEQNRVALVLDEMLSEKIGNKIKEQLEEYKNKLIDKEISNLNDIAIDVKIDKDSLNNKSKPLKVDDIEAQNVVDFQRDFKDESVESQKKFLTPQEEFENLLEIGNDFYQLNIKDKLYEYNINKNNTRVIIDFGNLLNNVMFKYSIGNKVKNNTRNISNSSKSYNIDFEDGFSISINSNNNSEYWEVRNDTNNAWRFEKTGDSLTVLLDNILKQYNVRTSNYNINKLIGNEKENEFLYLFPKVFLLEKLGAVKKSSNYEIGNCVIGIKDNVFSIWNRNNSPSASSIKMVQLIFNEVKEPHKEMTHSEAKEVIKNIYLNLKSYEIDNISSSRVDKSDDEMIKANEFKIMLPPMENDNSLMYDYLVNKRFINKNIVDFYAATNTIYQGLYDVNKKRLYRKYVRDEDIEWQPVVVFLGDGLASVRGCTPSGNEIKENVPGSNVSYPFVLKEYNADYEYKDDIDTKKIPYKLVFNEAPIDSLSYKSIFPISMTYSILGINTNSMVDALKEIHKTDSSVQLVYALDNVEITKTEKTKIVDGKEIKVELEESHDKASRLAYLNFLKKMADFSFEEFMTMHKEDIESKHLYNTELLEEVRNILIEKYKISHERNEEVQIEFNNLMNKISEKQISELNIYSSVFKETFGKIMFDVRFIDTNRFKLEVPSHPKYGEYKDWNEFLENIVLQKKKENPKLSLEEIHENIILEFNPDLQKKVPKQKPLNTVKMQ